MEKYDYLEHVCEDVKNAIINKYNPTDFDSREEFQEKLIDELWNDDGVTGNSSGSYYCNAYMAEEALCHNWDLLKAAMDEFEIPGNAMEYGAENCDVTLRCYVLPEAVSNVLDSMDLPWDED